MKINFPSFPNNEDLYILRRGNLSDSERMNRQVLLAKCNRRHEMNSKKTSLDSSPRKWVSKLVRIPTKVTLWVKDLQELTCFLQNKNCGRNKDANIPWER